MWLPTSEKYLIDFHEYLKSMPQQGNLNVLDLGCGCGILSFLFLKHHKKSKIFGFDKNEDAVKTFNLNASRLSMREAEAFQFDLIN